MTQPPRHGVFIENGHLPLNQPQLMQTPHAAQSRGRRHMHARGQRLIAQSRILLQGIQQSPVHRIQFRFFHKRYFYEIRFRVYSKMKFEFLKPDFSTAHFIS